MPTPLEDIDANRRSQGFLAVGELVALRRSGVIVLDPYSTLVSAGVRLGEGTVLYPNVIIRRDGASDCVIGSANTFWPQTIVLAAGGGAIQIGNGNQFGPGGVQIKANQAGARIVIGDRTRLLNGPEIVGRTTIGTGGQILGQIAVQSVTLAGGQDYTWPEVDERGAVLRGTGLARGLTLAVGDVVNGLGDFAQAPVERQRADHPEPAP